MQTEVGIRHIPAYTLHYTTVGLYAFMHLFLLSHGQQHIEEALMASTLYSDGYLRPVAQTSSQLSTVLGTVNTTSLISISSDLACDSSGRTVVWEADTWRQTHSYLKLSCAGRQQVFLDMAFSIVL